MRVILRGGIALILSAGSALAEPESFQQAVGDLAGTWTGALAYRDYQSDQRVTIPHDRELTVSPDGSFILSMNVYTDPGYKIYSGQMFVISGETVLAASSGSTVSVEESAIVSFETTADGWEVVLTGRGTDDGQPADRRSVWRLSGDNLKVTTSYRTDGGEEFVFRNAISLTRETGQ